RWTGTARRSRCAPKAATIPAWPFAGRRWSRPWPPACWPTPCCGIGGRRDRPLSQPGLLLIWGTNRPFSFREPHDDRRSTLRQPRRRGPWLAQGPPPLLVLELFRPQPDVLGPAARVARRRDRARDRLSA